MLDGSETPAQIDDLWTGLQALDQAKAAGDADAVRVHAAQLLNDYSDEFVRTHVGHALLFIGDAAEALPHLPADAHLARAFALSALGRLDEARREVALAEAQGDPGARDTAGMIENIANKTGQSARRVHADADPVEAEMRREAAGHFRRGEWDAGMTAHLRACDRSDLALGTKALSRIGGGECPAWSGEVVNHLLVICAFGNGDLLQFGRYITAARARCWRITLACEPIMHELMQRVLSVDTVGIYNVGFVKQQADAYTTVGMSFANALKMKYGEPMPIKPIDGSVPDLGDGVHVGLCWAASALGSHRSVRFAALSPLQFLPGVQFHSLQVGAAADEAGPWVKRHALSSYEDTTSLIAALDAVISVDTSVAHLAGNIGKPTHLLLCPYADGRWGMGDTTPWYPSMRLYRGNIGKAVKKIAERLREAGETKVTTREFPGQFQAADGRSGRIGGALTRVQDKHSDA